MGIGMVQGRPSAHKMLQACYAGGGNPAGQSSIIHGYMTFQPSQVQQLPHAHLSLMSTTASEANAAQVILTWYGCWGKAYLHFAGLR